MGDIFGKGSSPPAAPDPVATAKAQGEANIASALDTAKLANPNITTPYGSQTVTFGQPDTLGNVDYYRQHPELATKYFNEYISPKVNFTDPNEKYVQAYYSQNPNATAADVAKRLPDFAKEIGITGNQAQNALDTYYANSAKSTLQNNPFASTASIQDQVNQWAKTGSLTPEQAQAAVNRVTLAASEAQRTAQLTPSEYAQQNYDTTGKDLGYKAPTPLDKLTPNVTQTLTPEQTRILNEQNAAKLKLSQLASTGATNASTALSKPFSFGGPDVQTSLDTSNIAKMPINAGTTAQDAIMARLNPTLAKNRVSTETQLINQGLRPGTEAYDNAIQLLGQQENDQRTQAVLQGLGLDINANNQGFNQSVQSGQFANTAQGQALAQALTKRNQPLNEITALLSGSQINNPQFTPYTGANVAPAPIANSVNSNYQNQLSAYNTDVGSQNNMTSGLFSLGSAALKNPSGVASLASMFI